MEKIMPLELLSGLRGATSSEVVEELFRVIRDAVPEVEDLSGELNMAGAVSPDQLRSDVIRPCTDSERELIRKNFPREKNGFLVVPKVIEE